MILRLLTLFLFICSVSFAEDSVSLKELKEIREYVTATDIHQVSASTYYACALRVDGRVVCWGSNLNGQLGRKKGSGLGSFLKPAKVCGLSDIVSIDTAPSFACALDKSGDVYCWGSAEETIKNHKVRKIKNLSQVKQISLGKDHGCAVNSSKKILCWDKDFKATDSGRGSLRAPSSKVEQMEAGANFTCGVVGKHHQVTCTGNVMVAPGQEWPLFNVDKLSGGENVVCAVTDKGEAKCNGWDHAIPTVKNVKDIGVGLNEICVLKNDGTVKCWNRSHHRRAKGSEEEPDLVHDLTDVLQLSVGYEHSCVLLKTGTVRCWGAKWGWSRREQNGYFDKAREVKGL